MTEKFCSVINSCKLQYAVTDWRIILNLRFLKNTWTGWFLCNCRAASINCTRIKSFATSDDTSVNNRKLEPYKAQFPLCLSVKVKGWGGWENWCFERQLFVFLYLHWLLIVTTVSPGATKEKKIVCSTHLETYLIIFYFKFLFGIFIHFLEY